jgi:hypothetical protein
MTPQDRLLQVGRELLRKLREDRGAWVGLEPQLGTSPAGDEIDLHERERMQLAWALQYGGEPGDGELARFALEQEIAWREAAPYQGIGETLEILAWLVAGERRVEDVWLMARAKRANFDTGCGFDAQHLVTGGVEATLAHVRAAAPSEQERERALTALLGEAAAADARCELEDAQVEAWLAQQGKGYPRAPGDEPAELWIDRAIAIGEKELALQLLKAWSESESCERDVSFLGGLAHRLAELGAHDQEATVRDERLLILASPAERAGERCRAAEAARRAQQWSRALDHLDHAALLHRPRAAWRELGLGRDFVREAFELAGQAGEAGAVDVAQRAFTLGAELAEQTPRLPPVAVEARAKAEALLAKG